MPDQGQLLPGTLDLLILTLDLLILRGISLGPLNGYGVLLRIEHGWNRLAVAIASALARSRRKYEIPRLSSFSCR
jgi:hypothetical protein